MHLIFAGWILAGLEGRRRLFAWLSVTVFFITFLAERRVAVSPMIASDGACNKAKPRVYTSCNPAPAMWSCRIAVCIWTYPQSSKRCASATLMRGFSTIIIIVILSLTAFSGYPMD